MTRKVAIIGAGAAGLAAIKICLENDFDPICFEKSCDIGGWWNCQAMDGLSPKLQHPRILASAVSRSSKEFLAFSDFPPPKDFPTFPTQSTMLDYLRKYSQRFSLEGHVLLNTEVVGIKKTDSYQQTGRLIVEYRMKKSCKSTSETVDAIFLCTGHWNHSCFSEIQGLNKCNIETLHCSQYRNYWKTFERQRVLVVGLDNTSVSICLDLTHNASQVFLSLNGSPGKWLMSRFASKGVPWDSNYMTEWKHYLLQNSTTKRRCQSKLEMEIKNRFDHTKFGMSPDNQLWHEEPPIISDEFVTCIQSGKIILKPAIELFDSIPVPFVLFEDGTIETGIDAVILTTGFSMDLSLLEDIILTPKSDPMPLLHNHIFPVELSHPSLALIGLVYPVNGGDNGHVIAEMQCRFVCQALICTVNAPFRRKMSICCTKELNQRKSEVATLQKSYSTTPNFCPLRPTVKSPVYIDYISYMNSLAESLGIKPHSPYDYRLSMKLNYCLRFGPFVAYRFRLNGMNLWPGAAQALENLDSEPCYGALSRVAVVDKKPKLERVPSGKNSSFSGRKLSFRQKVNEITVNIGTATFSALREWWISLLESPQQHRNELKFLMVFVFAVVFFAITCRAALTFFY